ncbi:MAG: hypothetical protein R3F43_23335 [bacterium]
MTARPPAARPSCLPATQNRQHLRRSPPHPRRWHPSSSWRPPTSAGSPCGRSEGGRTALEGGRLLGSSIIWAAVALAGLSSPEELALQLGLGVAHGQVPWGSEAEALGAIPAIVRDRLSASWAG